MCKKHKTTVCLSNNCPFQVEHFTTYWYLMNKNNFRDTYSQKHLHHSF